MTSKAFLFQSRILTGVKEKPLIRVLSHSEMSSSSLASKVRCLSSARPLPVEGEEVHTEWQKPQHQKQQHIKALKRKADKFSKGEFSSVVSTEKPTDSSENDPFETISPTTLTYAGGHEMPVTTKLHIVTPEEDTPQGIWPVFRLMDENGQFRDPSFDGKHQPRPIPPSFQDQGAAEAKYDLNALRLFLSEIYPYHKQEFERNALLHPAKHPYHDTDSTNTLLRAHRQIVRLRQMDDILLNAQRQGRISFYMTCRGEEAIHMGAASALEIGDPLLCQYREQGLLMWRGFTLEQFTNQCFSNDRDLGKGRQMPVHYGSRALNYHTVSSPLGTQLPQAVGAAYRLKLEGKPNVAVCFFGDGCASTTDFHSAMNFAATLDTPCIFVCRNNGFAISTPVAEQYRGDGVIGRAPGYGMAGIRIDGNDVFAVHAAVREAKKYALENNAPVLIEAMTYRQGHHSTSDDSTRYRSGSEVEDFASRFDPLSRLEKFLEQHGWVSEAEAVRMQDEEKTAVLLAIQQAERRPEPPLDDLFEDVYHELPPHLKEQKAQLRKHLAKYPNKYK